MGRVPATVARRPGKGTCFFCTDWTRTPRPSRIRPRLTPRRVKKHRRHSLMQFFCIPLWTQIPADGIEQPRTYQQVAKDPPSQPLRSPDTQYIAPCFGTYWYWMGGGRGSQEFGKQACDQGSHLLSWSIVHFMQLPGLTLPDCAPKVMMHWMGPRLYSGNPGAPIPSRISDKFPQPTGGPSNTFLSKGLQRNPIPMYVMVPRKSLVLSRCLPPEHLAVLASTRKDTGGRWQCNERAHWGVGRDPVACAILCFWTRGSVCSAV